MAYVPAPYERAPVIRPTSGTATVALILALLWGFGFFSVIALVLVAASWKQTRYGFKGGHGLNVAALVIGLLGLVVPVFILAAVAAGSTQS